MKDASICASRGDNVVANIIAGNPGSVCEDSLNFSLILSGLQRDDHVIKRLAGYFTRLLDCAHFG